MLDEAATILVCDDDVQAHKGLRRMLGDEFSLAFVTDSEQLAMRMQEAEPALVLLDVHLRTEGEGFVTLPLLKRRWPWVPVVIYTGVAKYSAAVEAMRLGATDFIPKGTSSAELQAHLRKAIKARRKITHECFPEMVGDSAATQRLRTIIARVRESYGNVLITGESGVGKEIVARSLRKRTEAGFEPFVSVDCATIQGTMAESILFGHVRGAFTGAEQARTGLFEEANGGVLFFDEIANLPHEIQAKLLRVLQEKEIVRLGTSKPMKLDFRVVAATNRNLDELASQSTFRYDLLMRLNALTIQVEPLRNRREEISQLVHYFIAKHRSAPDVRFSPKAMELLGKYDWPGNVRELVNLVDYVATFCTDGVVTIAELPPKVRWGTGVAKRQEVVASKRGLRERVRLFEQSVLDEFYRLTNGNVAEMSRQLNYDRAALHAKLKRYGIHGSQKKVVAEEEAGS